MHSLLYNNRSGKVLMGGMQDKLIEFDLATAKETRVESVHGGNAAAAAAGEELRGSCAILRDHSRFVCCGDALTGKVVLRDPRSLRST